jgi:hypothetical protein
MNCQLFFDLADVEAEHEGDGDLSATAATVQTQLLKDPLS